MSDLLDELARTAAQPISRSRALRMLGGALVTAILPRALRPDTARATVSRAHIASCPACTDGGALCSVPKGVGCIRVCCPSSQPVCCTARDEVRCCYPGQQCGQVTIGNFQGTRCLGCPTGEPRCGSICCPQGSVCADPDIEYCCPPRESACKGSDGQITCCKPNQACCNGHCCPPGQRCHKGKCGKCPPRTRKCGEHNCCDRGEDCCNGRCCGRRQKCCNDDHCCGKDEQCCGERCCAKNATCCGDHCCSEGKTCCGDGCCPQGKTCVHEGGRAGCCPSGQVARTRFGPVCCQPGDIAVGDRCCPRGHPHCNDCSEPACRRGEVCRDGYCLPV